MRRKQFTDAQPPRHPCTCETPMERGWQGISNATLVGGVWRRSDVAQAAHLLACALHT